MNLPPKTTKTYLCEGHFEDNCFVDSMKSRLTKFAVPFKKKPCINIISNVIISEAVPQPPMYSREASASNTEPFLPASFDNNYAYDSTSKTESFLSEPMKLPVKRKLFHANSDTPPKKGNSPY